MNYVQELSRLQVLTDLVDFAKQQEAKGSLYTSSWARIDKWQEIIGYLRSTIPEDILGEFDNERRTGGHRENCQCMLCEERRKK